jgi:CRISPR-associated protein Csb1
MMSVNVELLRTAVGRDAAMRRVQKLQPVGGPGDKIFPPTYPGERRNDPPRHVFETRRVAGKNVLCVLIDSVQSQANRLEEAMKAARESGLSFPVIAVDFAGTAVDDIGRITTLDAPHRVFDAIMRDSEWNGTRLKDTDHGKRLVVSKPENARAVYELSPTALVFGAWNSTGEGGGIGAKFPRCVVSEIIGVGVATESRVSNCSCNASSFSLNSSASWACPGATPTYRPGFTLQSCASISPRVATLQSPGASQ